ncbi:collagen-like protein [Thalassotalea crassostreae]|uniref:collagen-like triple helix repeat-containing protein n=1 Tax=Thalassotalea crassostreae TaxID=1763536 RepID=UPI0008383D8D|nr:collagen-like protein [Thalassotalea crassostreae]
MKFKILSILITSLTLFACDGDDGSTGTAGTQGPQGPTGAQGPQGATGSSGVNCWDLNGNGVNEVSEDTNLDGLWTAQDCQTVKSLAQTQEATLNHQHFCEAFAELGKYPEGCPSDTHTVPTGTLTKMTSDTFFADGADGFESCAITPNQGLLSIKYNASQNLSYWVLEGAYIANQTTMSLTEVIDNNACFNECDNDPDCIASVASKSTNESFECLTFYHSDTISQWEQLCGVSFPGTTPSGLCIAALDDQRWSSKCP